MSYRNCKSCVTSSGFFRRVGCVLLGLVLSSCCVLQILKLNPTWPTGRILPSIPFGSSGNATNMQRLQTPFTKLMSLSVVLGEEDVPTKPMLRHCHVVNLTAKPEAVKMTTVKLRSNPPIVIGIYPSVKQDRHVSGTMKSGRVWEAGIVKYVMRALRREEQMGLLDIGANLGQYSLIAAKMGHQVVAVEALKRHINMVHKSVQLNMVEDKIVLVHNALSNSRRMMSIHQMPGNYGGSYIVNSTSQLNVAIGLQGNVPVHSILMDDLLEVIPFSKAVMKIDIEGHEPYAILGGAKLFEKLHIPYIFMEWGQLRGSLFTKSKTVTSRMLTFLHNINYQPYSLSLKPLSFGSWRKWPWDVFFKLKYTSLP